MVLHHTCTWRTSLSPRDIITRGLVVFCGLMVPLTLLLMALKLDEFLKLSWWAVLLPVIIGVIVVFLFSTTAVFVWINVAIRLCTGVIEVEPDHDFRLDILFRTAKICFLGHGYISLVSMALVLLLLKLQVWRNLTAVYPLLPLIVLGTVYIFLAVLFKRPEVVEDWFFVAGASMLSQSIMLVLKLEHFKSSTQLQWAVVFIPSWLTYALLLIYCVLAPLELWPQALADDGGTGGSTSVGDGDTGSARDSPQGGRLRRQLVRVAGVASWVIGWAFSQVALTLRLDNVMKTSWLAMLCPAFVGWILGLIFVTGQVSDYFAGISSLLLDSFGLVPLANSPDEEEPLAKYLGSTSSTPRTGSLSREDTGISARDSKPNLPWR
mmetsp:Transcript_26646/g.48835  ORF Transcript_26646/g.48835 Transcript_26646/m.48835 type:complete len:379 (-) Transcript_26646:14-1150(-)